MSQVFVSKNNSTTTPLAANATFIGFADTMTGWEEVDINIAGTPTVAPGTLYFEFSPDATNWDVSVPIDVTGPNLIPIPLRTILPFFRVRYVNGNIDLTSFRLTVFLHRTASTRLTRFLTQPIDMNEPVEVVRVAKIDAGTITANIGTTAGLALDSSLITIDTDIKSTQPRDITDRSGRLLGHVTVDNFPVTQPVSGTVTVNRGTNPWMDDVTDRAGRLLGVIYGSQGQQIKQTATNFNLQSELAVGGTLIDPRQIRTLTSSDVVTANAGSGTFTIGGVVTANIGTTNGLALDTSVNGVLLSQGSSTSGEKGPLIQGAVTTSAPDYTTGQTSPLSLTTTGLLRVDGSGVTQPVSGAVSISGTTMVSGIVNQGAPNTLANGWSVEITDGTNILGVSSHPVRIDPTGTTIQPTKLLSSTGTTTSIAGTVSTVTLLASNVNRLGVTIYNDSTTNMYVKLGSGATTSSFSVKMGKGAYYELPFGYTGIITGIWDSATGNARITELT